MNLPFLLKLGVAAVLASGGIIVTIAAAQAEPPPVSQPVTVTVPAIDGAEFCLDVDGQETCKAIPGVVGGTLTLTITAGASGNPSVDVDHEPLRCAGKPGVALTAATGVAAGRVSASLNGTEPATGSPINESASSSLSVASHTVAASVCRR